MRTRRSPRNQEIMWRELGGKKPKPVKADPVAVAERALVDPFLSPRMRRMFERDIQKAKARKAVRIALSKATPA